MKNEQSENIHRLMFMPDAKICFKICEYIVLYANNMQILDMVQIKKTNENLTNIYWLVFIQADKACFKKLENYLEE
jgi:predicted metal-dependent hydrolase